jgi:GLPGLI family protein
MKRLFLAVFIILIITDAYGQLPGNTPVPFDSAKLRVFYNYKAKNYTDSKFFTEDIFYLDIGSLGSDFYSFNNYMLDSAREQLISRGLTSEEVFLGTRSMKQGSEERIVKNYNNQSLTVVSPVFFQKYWYSEDLNVQEWNLTDDTLTVCSYLCYRAWCLFRGREWSAWYTPDIPSMDGPWKLTGLPGLILKAEDSKKEFIFESSGVMLLSPVKPLFHPLESKSSGIIKTDGKTFLQIKRKSVEDIKGSIAAQGMKIVTVTDEKGLESQIPKRMMNSIEEY